MTMLVLPTFLTHDGALNCVQSLSLGIRAESGEAVVIDASALERFDSSALAVLLQCRRDCAAANKGFEVTGLPHQLRELANLYGISELLDKYQGKHQGKN
jgi:phospholipid transport system transporter-binding protein